MLERKENFTDNSVEQNIDLAKKLFNSYLKHVPSKDFQNAIRAVAEGSLQDIESYINTMDLIHEDEAYSTLKETEHLKNLIDLINDKIAENIKTQDSVMQNILINQAELDTLKNKLISLLEIIHEELEQIKKYRDQLKARVLPYHFSDSDSKDIPPAELKIIEETQEELFERECKQFAVKWRDHPTDSFIVKVQKEQARRLLTTVTNEKKQIIATNQTPVARALLSQTDYLIENPNDSVALQHYHRMCNNMKGQTDWRKVAWGSAIGFFGLSFFTCSIALAVTTCGAGSLASLVMIKFSLALMKASLIKLGIDVQGSLGLVGLLYGSLFALGGREKALIKSAKTFLNTSREKSDDKLITDKIESRRLSIQK